MQMTLDGSRPSRRSCSTSFAERNGIVSPDGRWLAYEANDSGQFEIFVRPLSRREQRPLRRCRRRRRHAAAVGTRAARNCSIVSPSGALMSVGVVRGHVVGGDGTRPCCSKDGYLPVPGNPGRTYDISPDGQRFLMVKGAGAIGQRGARKPRRRAALARGTEAARADTGLTKSAAGSGIVRRMPSLRLVVTIGAIVLAAGGVLSIAQQPVTQPPLTQQPPLPPLVVPMPEILKSYAPVTAERLTTRRRRVADDPPHLRRLGLQPAGPDHTGQRRPVAAGVGVLDRRGQRPRGGAGRRQRRDVPVHAGAPRGGHRREDRPAAVALHQGGARTTIIAPHPTTRGIALYGDKVFFAANDATLVALDARTGAQVWSAKVAENKRRLLHDAGAAGGRRQGDGRRLGRRARRARLRRRLRRRDRQAAVAHLHRAGARRAGQRDLAQGRPVEERRRAGVGHRQLRPGHQPVVLGHRQRRAVDGRPAARATTSTPPPRWPSTWPPAGSRATSNITPTTPGTGTRCRRRSWSTSSATAAP